MNSAKNRLKKEPKGCNNRGNKPMSEKKLNWY
jgi:hypothetical protein